MRSKSILVAVMVIVMLLANITSADIVTVRGIDIDFVTIGNQAVSQL